MWLVLLAAGGTFALTMGVRQTMGLFLSALNTSTALGIGSISLAFAFGQLWWGLTQPFAGAVADRIGTGRVIFLGVVLVAMGTIITPLMTSTAGPDLCHRRAGRGRRRHGRSFGADGCQHAPGAAGKARPGHRHRQCRRLFRPVRDGADCHRPDRRMSAGPVPCSGWARWCCWRCRRCWCSRAIQKRWRRRHAAASGTKALERAARPSARHSATPSYRYLAQASSSAAFHVAFLATHLPGVVAACGLPPEIGGWALAMIGLFNIVGSLAMGWAVGRLAHEVLLAAAVRNARPGRAGLPAGAQDTGRDADLRRRHGRDLPLDRAAHGGPGRQDVFGTANMAMLFGVVMLSPPGRAASSAPGWAAMQMTSACSRPPGSYDWVWYIDIVLAVARGAGEPADPRSAAAAAGWGAGAGGYCRRRDCVAAVLPGWHAGACRLPVSPQVREA
jgi:MFS family permease